MRHTFVNCSGVAFSFTVKQGKSTKLNLEIAENLEDKKITYRTYDMTFRGTYTALVTYALEPAEAGTEFSYRLGYEMPWVLGLGIWFLPFSLLFSALLFWFCVLSTLYTTLPTALLLYSLKTYKP